METQFDWVLKFGYYKTASFSHEFFVDACKGSNVPVDEYSFQEIRALLNSRNKDNLILAKEKLAEIKVDLFFWEKEIVFVEEIES